jgi:hypothetical protein
MTIDHQFKHQTDIYFPKWPINVLLIGTFNPSPRNEYNKVNYYYGRPKNFTWQLISQILQDEINPKSSDFFKKIISYKIGCIDMIDSINFDLNVVDIESLTGKGYSDSAIFKKEITRNYNTKIITEIIERNKDLTLFSTWGKGSCIKGRCLAEWELALKPIKELKPIIPLVSPSPAARVPSGSSKFDFTLENWNQILPSIYFSDFSN